MKRIATLMLVLCMLFSFIPSALAFSDISDATEKAYISTLAEKGIVKGYNADIFAPNKLCTREEFITFLYRATGEPAVEKAATFADVPANAYYADAVSWAYANGITNGAGDGNFGVGKTIDRNLASFYLYKWADLTDTGYMTDSCYLADYKDGADVELYARTSFAWAIGSGAFALKGDKLFPATEITRSFATSAIARLLEKHYHTWSEYKDNGDGTHTRVCKKDGSHTETEAHTFNNGELTSPVSEHFDGTITYTCTKCMKTKTEKVKKGTEIVTRSDLEEAITATAWAYYSKGVKVQYDSWHFSKMHGFLGGICRMSCRSAPEFATKDMTFYSVCNDYVFQTYYEGLNMFPLGKVTNQDGMSTTATFRYSDNQRHTYDGEETLNDPITEDDVDAALIRWVNYDKYSKTKRDGLYVENVLESDSFTEAFPGLVFKNDAPDGESHYGYYDENGNAFTPDEAKEKYILPYLADCDKNFRHGDVAMYGTHTMLYIGNNTFLHCTGYKINPSKQEDVLEEVGAIQVACEAKAGTSISTRVSKADNFVVARPLDFVATGFDNDPGNDIVADVKIPKETKSRIKYPNMDIDRTVDITHFGTAVQSENLTYEIEISNLTDDQLYLDWYALENHGNSGKVTYKGITVTETIPEGCEFVEASSGGKFENNIITWNLSDIKPGEKVSLSYTVKVTASVGETIVNSGGMVADIPSNVIENTVGSAKLSDSEKSALTEIDKLEAFGGDTDFAEGIYRQLGKTLELPKTCDIIDNLFTYSSHFQGDNREVGGLYANNTSVNLFIRQTEASEEYNTVKNMLIDRYWGGASFYVGENLKWDMATNAIKETRTEFLEAGDILVYADLEEATDGTVTYSPNHIVVMVYDGEKLLASDKSADSVEYSIYEGDAMDLQLLKALFSEYGKGGKYEVFFALRPSQVK